MDDEPIIGPDLIALAKALRGIRPVDLPRIGRVYVCRPSDDDLDQLRGHVILQDGGRTGLLAMFAVRVLCDDEGNRLFTSADAGRVNKILSAAALQLIFEAVRGETADAKRR